MILMIMISIETFRTAVVNGNNTVYDSDASVVTWCSDTSDQILVRLGLVSTYRREKIGFDHV